MQTIYTIKPFATSVYVSVAHREFDFESPGGLEIGALALSPAGIYVQINAGAVYSLDQQKTAAAVKAAS